jgi:hypothetical protein
MPGSTQCPSNAVRCAELKNLDQEIDSVSVLENLSQAFKYTDLYVYEKAKYFLIEYNKSERTVRVKPYSDSTGGIESF